MICGESTCNNTRIQPTPQDAEPSPARLTKPQRETQKTYKRTKRFLAVEAFPIALLLCIPLFAHAGVFSVLAGMFSEETQAARVAAAYNAQSIPLLRAATHSDPNPSKGGGDVIVDAGALVPESGPGAGGGDATAVSHSNGEISVYVVREGDALSQIAEMYGVTPETILWANDIKRADLIQPGDSLVILPVSGVRYVVKSGDTLAEIAEEYHGTVDDIIAYNGLASETDVQVGDTVVIPGGEVVPPPVAQTQTRVSSALGAVKDVVASVSGYFSHPVPGAIKTQGIHGYNGVDLGAPSGTAIRAAASGEVIISKGSGWNGGYGNYIVIKHPNGTQTLYAHNTTNTVSAGQYVEQGEQIGTVGSTGRSTGSHLHFEVRGDSNPF